MLVSLLKKLLLQETTIYQPHTNDREAILEAEKKEENEAELKKLEEEETDQGKLEKEKIKAEASISFRGDIKTPPVNIEVSVCKITFPEPITV